MKPFSEACVRNREPILEALREIFAEVGEVLEIGSGTGQHAAYFPAHLPHLCWQPSDLPHNLPGIQAWLDEAGLPNVRPPLALDLFDEPWPVARSEAVFCANTIHIVSWAGVERLFAGAGRVLAPGGILCLYGPFNYGGRYTSASNAQFDAWLKARDPASGIRDFEAVDALARAQGLRLVEDRAMPANNRLIWWVRTSRLAPEQPQEQAPAQA